MTSRDASARLQLESFRKILNLEASKGLKNDAVVGGLDRFLERNAWVFRAIAGDDDLSVPYCDLTPSQRQEWIQDWLARLEDIESLSIAVEEVPGDSESPAGPIPSDREKEDIPPPSKGPPLRPTSIPSGVSLDSPVNRLRGVNVKLSEKLLKLDVAIIRDLLYLLPRHHNDFSNFSRISELVVGEKQNIVATVWEARETRLGQGGKLKATEAVVSDETGNIRAVWIGQPHIARLLKPNSRVALSGKVEAYKGQLQLKDAEFEILDKGESLIHTGRLVPVYPGTEGLPPRRLRSIVWQALEQWVPRMEDFIPEGLRKRAKLVPLPEAILQAHYPDDLISLERARKRLAFDEFFLIQMAVLMRRSSWQSAAEGISVQANPKVRDGFIASLPFSLTDAQERCLREILTDMAKGTPPMNRLLQGEVGSGKTVVALAGLLEAVAGGYQGSIMVPTEVLAEQHFATVSRLLGGLARPLREENLITVYLDSLPRPISVGLLTGSTRAALKRELQQRVSEGTLDIAIGTHALIQEGVEFPRLALAVVDEQHRFGVMQRAALRQRSGTTPHLLVMSATPIPRTLALTIYGDLDVSTIDQLPPGRQQVLTRNVSPEERHKAYGFVRKEVRNGRQAFVICPLIEESDAVAARAATEEYERLSTEVFPDLRLGLLHGRMTSGEKDEVMGRFRNGETDILVSTAVVEVGIDVPNATVMVVEGAHRFGLSQLHQFRGRVGRGENKSYCLLLSDYSTPEAKERLSAVERIHDGFQLAEVDLSLRGPGDYFGTRQSGLPALRVARLSDHDLLRSAREEAAGLLQDDPDLLKPHHESLSREVARFLDKVRAEVS